MFKLSLLSLLLISVGLSQAESDIDKYCPSGFAPHPSDIHRFYMCERDVGKWRLVDEYCPGKSIWVQADERCEQTDPKTDQVCAKVGYVPNDRNMHQYYKCQQTSGGKWRLTLGVCPDEFIWLQNETRCAIHG